MTSQPEHQTSTEETKRILLDKALEDAFYIYRMALLFLGGIDALLLATFRAMGLVGIAASALVFLHLFWMGRRIRKARDAISHG